MAVPTYDRFIEPVLRYLAAHPEGAKARDAHEAAANALGISESDRAEVLPSGTQTVYKNRAGWAHDRLKRAGLSTSPQRGFWKLSDAGLRFAREHTDALSDDELGRLVADFLEVRLRDNPAQSASSAQVATPTSVASPDDRLDQALGELRATVARELLEALGAGSPKFFESVVLDLLHAMGYGASRSDLQRVGGAGDGGIDGIISRNRSRLAGSSGSG